MLLRWQIELHFHFRFQPDMNFILCSSWLWIATETRNSCFLVFLNFLFLGRKWGTRNKKSIFFIFCFIFCLILAKFWPFLMIFQSIMMIIHISPASTTFLGCSIAFIWVLGVENMAAWIWYVQILLIYELHRGKFFLVFFLFLARNGSEFLVSCKKSKSKKNGTHSS